MADELKTVLGFDATEAIKTLAEMEKKLISWTAAMNAAAAATAKYNTAGAGVEASIKKQTGAVTGFSTQAKKASATSKKLAEETNVITAAMSKYGKTATKIPSTHPAFAKQAKDIKDVASITQKASKDMILSWKSVIRIFAIQVIHQMLSKITASLGEAVRNTIDLENRLAEIQTIGGPLKDNFEGLSKEVRSLSDEFAVNAETVAEGIYQTLSNQVADAGNAFTFFAASAKFSIAAVTSADASVNLLSSTINAFGYTAASAEVIGGKLFKTIELGRIRGEEFADTFGRVAVLASNLGVSLDETLAAIATLTISGLKYNEAFTLITNTMLKLLKPTDAMKDAYAEMGVVSAEAAIQAFGFLGFLDKLAISAGGTATEVSELFSRLRAIRGVLGLTGTAAEKAAENLKAIREAGSTDLIEAQEIVFRTNAKAIQIEIEELRNALLFDFGRPAIGVVAKLFDTFGGAVAMVKALTIGLGFAAAAATGLAIATWPIASSIAAIGLATAGIALAYEKIRKTAITTLEDRIKAERKAIAKINIEEAELAEQRVRRMEGQFSDIQKYLIGFISSHQKMKKESTAAEKFISDVLNEQLKKRASAYEDFVSQLNDKIKNAATVLADNQQSIISLEQEQSTALFNIKINQYNAYEKHEAALLRVRRLINQAEEATRDGHEDIANSLYAEAKSVAQISVTAADELNNIVAKRDAESALRQIYIAQLNTQKKKGDLAADQARIAKKVYAEESARADRISAIIKRLQDIKIFGADGKIKFATPEDATAAVRPLVDALRKEFDAVGKKKNIFKRLDLEQSFKDITAPFEDAFTRKPVTLDFLYKQRIAEVFKDIATIAKQHPIPIKLTAESLGFDITSLKGVEDLSRALPKLAETYTKAIRLTAGHAGEQEKLTRATDNTRAGVRALREEMMSSLSDADIFYNSWLRLLGREPTEGLQNLSEGFKTVDAAVVIANEQINDFTDPEKFKSALLILDQERLAFENLGNVDAAAGIRLLIEELRKAGIAAETLKLQLDQLRIIQKTEAALNPIGHKFGGMIYRQLGGFTPQGTDTVPAMLSPGEFVVNAAATKRFYSQLVAINSGVKPVFREQGGPVTNVGDVNITVTEATSAKATARETMSAFRREMRRNTSRSF